MLNELDFTIEKVDIELAQMDLTDVQSGCWGDSGSDWANNC